MGWFSGWFRRNGGEDGRAEEWRRAWADAVSSPDAARADDLRARLRDILAGHPDDDALDIEREMLDGLDALVELSTVVAQSGPPMLATGHRVVGTDRCHFSAPASLPDDPAQPGGTLLLTSTRAVFAGGARAVTIPWHRVGECTHHDRDLVLVSTGSQDLQRIRLNNFADALSAVFLARHLASPRAGRQA